MYYCSSPGVIESQIDLLPEELNFVESVKQHGVAQSDACLAIEMHGLEGAIEIRDYVLHEATQRQKKKNQVRDIGAYMIRCFHEGFGRKTINEKEIEVRNTVSQDIKFQQEQARERVRNEAEQLRKDFWTFQTDLVDERIACMSDEEKQSLEKRFVASNSLWAKRFKETGLNTPLVRSAFYSFAVQEFLDSEQRDISAFARSKGVSIEVINLLESFGS